MFLLRRLWIFLTISCVMSAYEREMVVVILSYNNASYYKKNLDSLMAQNYTNYRVIYVDDCSCDRTGDLVFKYIQKHGLHDKITLIRNTYNRKALCNMYKAVHSCDDQVIIVEFDGDDFLTHSDVLARINQCYEENDVWFTYAQFRNITGQECTKGLARPTPQQWIQDRDYRRKWAWSGLRSYYAWLYKLIKLEDMILEEGPYTGKFLPAAKDGAGIYPILEMAGSRFAFIPDILLDRNLTPINDFKVHKDLQIMSGNFLRTVQKYPLLPGPVIDRMSEWKNAQADLIIICQDGDSNAVEKTLRSFQDTDNHVRSIHIFCPQECKKKMQEKTCVDAYYHPYRVDKENWFEQSAYWVSTLGTHVIIARAGALLSNECNCTQAINDLERTSAYSFALSKEMQQYFAKYQDISKAPYEHLWDNVHACKPHTLNELCKEDIDIALLRASDVIKSINSVFDPISIARRVVLFYQ